MTYYAGIDVSLQDSSICVVDENGKIIREAKVPSDPESLAAYFRAIGFAISRIGLEAGSLSQWLHEGLTGAGFDGSSGDATRQGGAVCDGGQN